MQDLEKKSAVQSFNRINDPVVDQDNAKILGALGGGYGAWKHHANSVAKRKGIFDRLAGKVSSPVTRPTRALVGAGLGALAAGTLARYMNKQNKEDHQETMAQAKAMQAPQYPMYSYASEKTANENVDYSKKKYPKVPENFGLDPSITSKYMDKINKIGLPPNSTFSISDNGKLLIEKTANENDLYDTQEKTKMDKMVGKGIRGGILGALASAILGGKGLRGAGIGALAGAGHEAYKQYKHENQNENQNSAPSQTEQINMYPQYNNMDSMYDKYAHITKEARIANTINKMFGVGGKAAKKSTGKLIGTASKAKDRAAYRAKIWKHEVTNNAPGVDAAGNSIKG